MYDDREIQDVIERVRRRYGEPGPQLARQAAIRQELEAPAGSGLGDGVFATLNEAVAAAAAAYRGARLDLDLRKTVIEAVRRAALDQAEPLARLAVEETGLGGWTTRRRRTACARARRPAPRTSRCSRCRARPG